MGANPALALRAEPVARLGATRIDQGECLVQRIERLLHPQFGLCRGMILNTDKPHDKPEDPFPTTVRELLEVRSVLTDCAAALRKARGEAQ